MESPVVLSRACALTGLAATGTVIGLIVIRHEDWIRLVPLSLMAGLMWAFAGFWRSESKR